MWQPVLKLCNMAFIKVSVKATFISQPLVCYITQRGIARSFPPRRLFWMGRSHRGCPRRCLAVRSAPMAGEQRYETPQRHHVACNRPWSFSGVIRQITFGDIVSGVDVTHNSAVTVIKGKNYEKHSQPWLVCDLKGRRASRPLQPGIFSGEESLCIGPQVAVLASVNIPANPQTTKRNFNSPESGICRCWATVEWLARAS